MNPIKEQIKEIKLKNFYQKIEKQGIDSDILNEILNWQGDI